MDILDIYENVTSELQDALKELPYVSASDIEGLDRRCGSMWFDINNGLIITNKHNTKSLKYYGGFEYVDNDAIMVIGDYTIFDAELDTTERVANVLEMHNDYIRSNI